MKIENIIAEAIRQAKKSGWVFKLGAVVFDKDHIIGTGYNRAFNVGSSRRSSCAEVLAIQKSSYKIKGATILVCRSNMGMAKPCERCRSLIEKSGIRKVIYSTPNGFVSYMVR